MIFYRIWAVAGAISIGLMGSAFSHTTSKHYVPKRSATHHYVAPKKTWHPAPHPPGTGHSKGYHAPAHKTWHPSYKPSHKTWHKTYHKPAPPRPVPGIRSDGRYMLPGGMESTCSGGTPPPCH